MKPETEPPEILFRGSASRAVAEGGADYTSVNFGDVPWLFQSGAISIDVALIQVPPPEQAWILQLRNRG